MGGIGSGTWTRWDTRPTVEDMKPLRIGALAKGGWLHSGTSSSYRWSIDGRPNGEIHVTAGGDHIRLNYRHQSWGGDWVTEAYPVGIAYVPCHFGGSRPWFICPAVGCGRKAGTLYGGRIFACRTCHGLAYPSENEGRRDRAIRKADKLRERLGWPRGVIEGSGWGKRPYMRQATYEALTARYEELESEALVETMAWLVAHRIQV